MRRAVWALAAAPGTASAHAFGARYELPVPVWLFIVGAALTVTLTFVVVAAFAGRHLERFAAWRLDFSANALPRAFLVRALQTAGLVGLALVIVAGLIGTRDPNRNIAPTLVWIVWWVGFTYLAMLVGNAWPSVNPWRTLHGLLAAPAQPPARWPARLGAWPAVAGLLAFGWVELVFPFRAAPLVLSWLALGYTAVSLAGMRRYGAPAWLENADPFHRVFEIFSRFAPLARTAHGGLALRPYGAGLLARESARAPLSEVAFIMAMLAIVLFDGFQGSKHWAAVEDAVHAWNPSLGDAAWIALHTFGLLAMWLVFLALYLAACAAARAAAGGRPGTLDYARAFAPTLIPIAVGYQFAHTFTYLLVQGQTLSFLVSDPFGLGWNLFGTREATVDIAIIGTRTAWYLALAAIVAGHTLSVWLAHAAAERLLAGRAVRALVPITALMVLYTVISLQILAEPLVRYSGPQETII